MVNKLHHTTNHSAPKFIKTMVTMGAFLFITLIAKANPCSAAVQKELAEIFKKNPDKEIVVTVDDDQGNENTANFEMVPDTTGDPYDEIRQYVGAQDIEYFNQLKACMESKNSDEQIKCKAVVYAILQDTQLNQEQRQTLALAYFERLARMPGSNYRFRTAGNKKYETNTVYADRRNRYSGYKSYLELVDIQAEGRKLEQEGRKLEQELKLLQNLLNTYQQK